IKFNSNRLTHFGGIYLFHLFLKQIGWRSFITLNIRHEQRNNHYTISELIFSLLYPVILGLSRIEISKLLGRNGVFKLLIGLNRFPNPTTLRRFLIRGSDEFLPQFIRLHDQLRKYFINLIVPEKKLLLDVDSTVCTLYGHQEGAAKGYNPGQRGKRSYHPLFCFEHQSGTSLFGLLRHGNAYTSAGTLEYLKTFFQQFPQEKYSVRLRGDSGFYDKDIVALLSQNHCGFAIVAEMTGPLKNLVIGLKYHAVKGFDNRYSFAETFYQPMKWERRYRYCVIRKKLEPEESDQSTLFTINAYSYSAIVTNLSMTPANIWKFYNGRVQCERNIRSMKEDYYLGNIPTQKFNANGLYLEILLWAYDLIKWFQRLCLPVADHNKTLQTLRNELLLMPGSFAQHGSRQILRFPRNSPQQKTFWSAKDKIDKLKDLNKEL
ncbi:MAG: IS1380 family transposase, partial [Candidatus Magasanikbacteria bacterium]|nr:IS1380 family transposase [Candidatus Magasanikbacteria bacterium]